MLPDDITKLLPPIGIGVGILLPGFFKASPFQIPARLRSLTALVSCLLCWIAYYFVIGLGRHWLFDPWMTIGPSLLAVLFLVTILVVAWKQKEILTKNWPFFMYLASIFFFALGAGNWVGQKNVKIVTFKSSKPLGSVEINLMHSTDFVRISPLGLDITENKWTWLIGPEDTRLDNLESARIGDHVKTREDFIPIFSGFPAKTFEVIIDD